MSLLTQPPDPEVVRRWRSGPRWYYVIAAMIDCDRVEDRRRQAADALGTLLQPTTPGQPHVTLSAVGFQPVDSVEFQPVDRAEFRPVDRAEFQPVDWVEQEVPLTVRGAACFPSAVYLQVDSPALVCLRDSLRIPDLGRTTAYVPHVTVGTFRRAVAREHVMQMLRGVPDAPIPATAPVRLMAVDTRSPVGALRRSGPGTAGGDPPGPVAGPRAD